MARAFLVVCALLFSTSTWANPAASPPPSAAVDDDDEMDELAPEAPQKPEAAPHVEPSDPGKNPIKGDPSVAGLSTGLAIAGTMFLIDVVSVVLWPVGAVILVLKAVAAPALTGFLAWYMASKLANRRVPIVPLMVGGYVPVLITTVLSILAGALAVAGVGVGVVSYVVTLVAFVVGGFVVGAFLGCLGAGFAGGASSSNAFALALVGALYGGIIGAYIGLIIGYYVGIISYVLSVIAGVVSAVLAHVGLRICGDVAAGVAVGIIAAMMGRTLEPGEEPLNYDWFSVPRGRFEPPAKEATPPAPVDALEEDEEEEEPAQPPLDTPDEKPVERTAPPEPAPQEAY
ncbi:MAG: hypothetical protein AB2A00_32425 [Myxococcota bacterium]